jgi:hypothetical protein
MAAGAATLAAASLPRPPGVTAARAASWTGYSPTICLSCGGKL